MLYSSYFTRWRLAISSQFLRLHQSELVCGCVSLPRSLIICRCVQMDVELFNCAGPRHFGWTAGMPTRHLYANLLCFRKKNTNYSLPVQCRLHLLQCSSRRGCDCSPELSSASWRMENSRFHKCTATGTRGSFLLLRRSWWLLTFKPFEMNSENTFNKEKELFILV